MSFRLPPVSIYSPHAHILLTSLGYSVPRPPTSRGQTCTVSTTYYCHLSIQGHPSDSCGLYGKVSFLMWSLPSAYKYVVITTIFRGKNMYLTPHPPFTTSIVDCLYSKHISEELPILPILVLLFLFFSWTHSNHAFDPLLFWNSSCQGH